jgi:sugar lactone lactonase YvrE
VFFLHFLNTIRTRNTFRAAALCSLAAVGLVPAACSAPLNSGQMLAPTATQPWMPSARALHLKHDNLYVANAKSIAVYAVGSTTPSRTISNVFPVALTFDGSGALYAANVPPNLQNGEIVVYHDRASTPFRTLTKGIRYPQGLTVDASGKLIVANYYASVAVYSPKHDAPVRQLQTLFSVGLALDPAQKVYVALNGGPYGSGGGKVEVFAPGQSRFDQRIVKGIRSPVAVAMDAAGNLYVVNSASITVYAAANMKLVRTITRGLADPRALAFDAAGNLYVANNKNSSVTVYAPGTSTVAQTIRDGVLQPRALAIGKGQLFVANRSSVTAYDVSTGALVQTITSGINHPAALALGP